MQASQVPLFSVIIPLYNKELYIIATLRSVLAQSYQDFEVIIIDDGSTDNSLNIVLPYRSSRVKIYTKENGGASSARNYGITRARAKYIAFLDADDTWAADYLLKMMALIERYPGCGLYISAYYIIEEDKEYANGETLEEGIIKDFFKAELEHHIIRLSASVTPKVVFKKIGGFPVGMISGEDGYLCALVAMAYKIAYTPQLLVTYNNRYSGADLRYDKGDTCRESWLDLHEEDNVYRNEFIALKALKAGIRNALALYNDRSLAIEQYTKTTEVAKRQWLYLFILNRLPAPVISLYKVVRPFLRRSKKVLQL